MLIQTGVEKEKGRWPFDPLRLISRARMLETSLRKMLKQRRVQNCSKSPWSWLMMACIQIAKLSLTRGGGAYIPPHRMRAIMGETAALQGGASPEFQRLSWDALRKSINGLINKVNVANIKQLVPELFGENLMRGRGLYCRSIMRAQAASMPFTPVFAALTAIVNTKLPQVGELLLTRLVSQFRRSFKRNDKVRRRHEANQASPTHTRFTGIMHLNNHLYRPASESTSRT